MRSHLVRTRGSDAARNDPRCTCLVRVLVPILAFVAGGCTAGTDTSPLDAVAVAGIAYTEHAPRVLDRAFDLAVAVDSAVLATARAALSEQQRRERLQAFDAAMSERLKDHTAAKRHNRLLGSYFLALRTLLESRGSKGMGEGAGRLTASLAKLSPTLENARMGDVVVRGLVEPVTDVAVAAFTMAALRREAEARGVVIERALALQEALMTAVAQQVRADRAMLSAGLRNDEVVEPYVHAARLPKTWPARRVESLRGSLDAEATEAAAQAIRSLRKSYVAAIEGRLDPIGAAELDAAVKHLANVTSRLGVVRRGTIR